MIDSDKNNNDLWKWGLFYNNPNDSSIWVEKRSGLGWTLNFAHAISYSFIVILLAIPIIIIWLKNNL